MHLVQSLLNRLGLRYGSESDAIGAAQRSPQPFQSVVAKIAVLSDTLSDPRMSDLQNRRRRPEQESTLLVMVSVVILGLFVASIDWLIMLGLNALVTK